MSKTILAGVLALFLGPGAAQVASAEPSAQGDATPGVFQLFGRTLCLADAPAEARCDWRAAAAPRPADDGLALTLFGTRYCLSGTCDQGDARPEDGTFRLFGMTWCTTSKAGCDVVLPAQGTETSPAPAMHASR